MSVSETPQTSLYETVLEDPELEEMLGKRAAAKDDAKAASKAYRKAHEEVLTKLAELELGDGAAVRVGGFVISKRLVQGGTREFDVADREQLSIRQLKNV